MLRTALFRSARAVARQTTVRQASSAALPALRAQRAAARQAPSSIISSLRASPTTSFLQSRRYAGGGGLAEEDVQGRIMGLLQGFDKV